MMNLLIQNAKEDIKISFEYDNLKDTDINVISKYKKVTSVVKCASGWWLWTQILFSLHSNKSNFWFKMNLTRNLQESQLTLFVFLCLKSTSFCILKICFAFWGSSMEVPEISFFDVLKVVFRLILRFLLMKVSFCFCSLQKCPSTPEIDCLLWGCLFWEMHEQMKVMTFSFSLQFLFK